MLASALLGAAPAATAQPTDQVIVDARDALRLHDRVRLAALRDEAVGANLPLAMWPDYWELLNRIGEVRQAEVDAFSARWPGTYVEDRFRNDWLLELGRRRDWVDFATEYPRFRMDDDRQVRCYALMLDQQAGKDVHDTAFAAWLDQRDADDGCALMAATFYAAKTFSAADLWRKARISMDGYKPKAARQAAGLIAPAVYKAVSEIIDNPARYLARKGSTADRTAAELTTLALIKLADNDPEVAATQLDSRWSRALPADLATWVWGSVGKQAAVKLLPTAADYFQRAGVRSSKASQELDWPDETLAWKARAALRTDAGKPRWQQVTQAITAMSDDAQRDPTWVYWKARALEALSAESQDAASMRAASIAQLEGIAGRLDFYGLLAAERLGRPAYLPPVPAPLTAVERETAARNPALVRGLQLIALGLRSEGVREWNYGLRGMADRPLLAAAQLACDLEIWDRCINTSDRTKVEIDLKQRYPLPYQAEVVAAANEIGLDAAWVYGLIRQESRFVVNARSSVGASGLMQLMPATARWTAKKIGLDFHAGQITDRAANLKLGTAYLKLVLEDFNGSEPLATAAYNAGPNRPRRWRDGPPLEPAIWAENVPFGETRDYVKKVMGNAFYYAVRINGEPTPLTARLGPPVAPESQPNPLDKDLP